MPRTPDSPPRPAIPPESRIQYQDLTPEVRSYADNLLAQAKECFTRYGITEHDPATATAALTAIAPAHTNDPTFLPDIRHLHALLTQLDTIRTTGVLPPEARETQPITVTVRADAITTIPAERGHEVTLDLREVLTSSLAFLEAKAPPSWAQSLREEFPHGLALTPDQRATIEAAIAYGFTRVILMPGADVQGTTAEERTATTDHLLNTCTNADGSHPVSGLPTGEQYTAPFVNDPEKTKASTLRPNAPSRQRPYLILTGPGNIPENLKNLTYPDAEAAITHLATTLHLPTLTGLATSERLLLQRKECEARAPLTPAQRTATYGDARPHAFDEYSGTATESNWTWDLDSRVPSGASAQLGVPDGCCRGGWNPGGRQSELDWGGASDRLSELGARPAVVVPL